MTDTPLSMNGFKQKRKHMNNQEKIKAMGFWWDYSNNYLTVDLIAEHRQIEKADAQALIDSGREQWDAASVDDRQTAIDSIHALHGWSWFKAKREANA